MSSLRPKYITTGVERAERHKKRSESSENGNSSNKITIDGGDLSTDSKSREGNDDNKQISIDTETIDICDSCKKSPEAENAVAICRLCSDLICNECMSDLQPSTFADIEKSGNLLFFCNDCIDTVSNKIRKIHEGKSVASIGSAASELRTDISDQRSSEDAISHDHTNTNATVGNVSKQFEHPKASSASNQIDPGTMTSLVKAVQDLQVEMRIIKNSFTSNRKVNNPTNPTTTNTVIEETANRGYANAARDENAPPAIVIQNCDTTPDTPVSLEGRELVSRPMVPSEIIEERDRERRKFNIIVQNLPESKQELSEDRKKEDIMEARCLLAGMQLSRIGVKSAVRLGKKNDKPRSLMVTLDSERGPVLSRAKMIRKYKCWMKVFIDPNRTPKEQEEHKKLFDDFKKRKENGENLIFRNGKISERRKSYLDLNTLITQAEQRKESTADLINLASSENLDQQASTSNAGDKNENAKDQENKADETEGPTDGENQTEESSTQED